MPALVRSNSSLASGNIARVKHSWAASNTGEMSYSASYACLSRFTTNWIEKFKTGSQPPLPIPEALLSLNLTRIPDLADLQMETANGLTYFNATYTAGVATDVTITQSSEVRNISWVSAYIGNNRIVSSFDYISNSVRMTGTNAELPVLVGSVGQVFNARNVDAARVMSGGVANVTSQTIQTTSVTKNGRGEYINSVSSAGIYVAYDAEAPVTNNQPPVVTTQTAQTQPIRVASASYGRNNTERVAFNPPPRTVLDISGSYGTAVGWAYTDPDVLNKFRRLGAIIRG